MDISDVAAAHFVAGDLALDFINTRFGPDAQRVDILRDDESVLQWLTLAGVQPAGAVRAPRGLATLARALRDEAHRLVMAACAGDAFDAKTVNEVLEAGRPGQTLVWDARLHRPARIEHRRNTSSASLLHPVAAALVQLLTEKNLQHVRRCEAHDCTLLFHDTTKSHRRRWCSMALCGNRMKVAAYRSRQHAD